jgi:hypothetical protein
MPGSGGESSANNNSGNDSNGQASGKTGQVHLPGRSEPLAKNNYIHLVRPGCVFVDRFLIMQVAKLQSNCLYSIIRVVINLLSLLTSVAPLS